MASPRNFKRDHFRPIPEDVLCRLCLGCVREVFRRGAADTVHSRPLLDLLVGELEIDDGIFGLMPNLDRWVCAGPRISSPILNHRSPLLARFNHSALDTGRTVGERTGTPRAFNTAIRNTGERGRGRE